MYCKCCWTLKLKHWCLFAGQSLRVPGYSSLVSFDLSVIMTFYSFAPIRFLDGHNLSHNLVMKHIPGADPELVLLNHYYEELDVSAVLIFYGPPLKNEGGLYCFCLQVSVAIVSQGLQGVYLNFPKVIIWCTATTDELLEAIQLNTAAANWA